MRKNKSRFIYMVLAGIAVSLLLHSIIPFPVDDHNRLHDFFISIIITLIVWEGNLRIDTLMNEKFPWVVKPGRRLLVHLPTSLIFSVLAIYLPMMFYDIYVCRVHPENKEIMMSSSVVIGILITIIILSIEISTQFFSHWKASVIEIEKHKKENLQAQLENLRNQVNPHFLFNNLSVLSSLVYKDQDKAVEFINQLSKVYRYVLDNKDRELVELSTELTFIESYCYLLNIRFGENIKFFIEVPDTKYQLLLPPMALQLLIENAIKHNEVSGEQPLEVKIKIEEDYLVVTNNLQLRKAVEDSSKTGLNNIISRYKHFTEKNVMVNKTSNLFEVKIPLLTRA